MFPGLPTPGPNLPRGRLSKKSPRAGKGDRGAPSRSRGAAVGGGRGSAGPQTGGAAGVGSGGRETRGPLREGLQVDLSLRLREARKREGFLAYPAHGEHGVVLASPRGVRQGGGSGQGQTHPSGCGKSGLAYGRGDGGPRRDTPRVLAVGLAGTDAGREVVAANQRGSSQRALRGDRGDRANVAAQMRGVARSSGVDRRPHQLPLVAPDGMRFRILFTRIPYEPFGEVVSRALRPEIIPAQAAEELFGDGSYLLVGPLPRGSLGGETDVDLPSADLARAHQRGERRIRGAEKVADLLAQLLLADPGELEHHGDDRTLAALPDPGLERLLEHPCISAGTPGNVAKSTPSSS